jgi:hypothetical protein
MDRNTIIAISLWQPWATLVAIGAKRIETRGWSPWYRGALVIHASKRFAVPERDLCDWPIFKVALARGGYTSWKELPLGAAVCLTELRGGSSHRRPPRREHRRRARPGRA